MVAARLVGRSAAPWAAALLALSPIHLQAILGAGPDALLVPCLLSALWLVVSLEARDRLPLAAALGLALGGLAASGVAAFAGVAVLLTAFVATRRARALVAPGVAIAVVAAAALVGLARAPFGYGDAARWIPETTAGGVIRCAGASFTRVVGLEYQLVVPHARYALPLTALFVALMVRGALRLPPRARVLLVAGASLPFALGATLALFTGRVTPLQASRLIAALPFTALLTAAGLASLRGARAWAAGTAVLGSLAASLALALGRY